jgi:2-dehydropantoate 2-reductase
MSKDDILIVGSGAMACLFAARLSNIAHVTMLGSWTAGLQALKLKGVRVVELDGERSQAKVEVLPRGDFSRRYPIALVLVKSWQTERAAYDLLECLEENGTALTLQNGLGNAERLADVLGADRVSLGVTTTGATLVGPGLVRHGGTGPTYISADPRLDLLVASLEQAGFEVHREQDLQALVWTKLAVNAAINPLTALLEIPNGRLLELESALELMAAAANEVADLAETLGIQLTADDPAAFSQDVAKRTAENLSSMLQDIQRGAPTEIDAICGEISRRGALTGTPTPFNDHLWKLVSAKAAHIMGA